MADWQIRDAAPDELAAAFAIFHDYEFHDDPAPPPFVIPDFFPYVARTGRVLVAADGARIVGYAGAITRGDVTHLTDLFVRPAVQSGSIGRALLAAILPDTGTCCTCSTADPRALSLYVRAGMRPWWPQFALYGAAFPAGSLADGTVEIAVVRADHPALIDWEREIGGRPRAEDFAYWAAHGAVALWLPARWRDPRLRHRAPAWWHGAPPGRRDDRAARGAPGRGCRRLYPGGAWLDSRAGRYALLDDPWTAPGTRGAPHGGLPYRGCV